MSHSYATAILDGLVSFSVAVEADPTQVVGRWRVPPCSMIRDALQPAPCSSMGTGAAPVFSTSWATLWYDSTFGGAKRGVRLIAQNCAELRESCAHLRRGEANGEEDGGAAGDDALARENREDSGGVLSDGEEHGGVPVVLKGHLNGYIWREGGRGQEWEEGETGGRGVFESCMRLTVW